MGMNTYLCLNLFAPTYLRAQPISVDIFTGNHLWVRGPSGIGKSSLLRSILGLSPFQGTITWQGEELKGSSLVQFRRQCGWVPQEAPTFSGTLEYWLPQWNRAWQSPNVDLAEVVDISTSLGLPADFHTRDMASLSGGERRRLFLSLALARKCSTFLFDETFASFDVSMRNQVWQKLQLVQPKMVITIAHDEQAAPEFTHILELAV